MTADTTRLFPVLGSKPPEGVPWAFVAQYAMQALVVHGQTLERLAERGGLSWSELRGIAEGRNVFKFDRTRYAAYEAEARTVVARLMEEWAGQL